MDLRARAIDDVVVSARIDVASNGIGVDRVLGIVAGVAVIIEEKADVDEEGRSDGCLLGTVAAPSNGGGVRRVRWSKGASEVLF